jgi:uncharacterized protein (TIGR02996 family)
MVSHESFLHTIEANPDLAAPRLVYADYLEELGDSRGEILRLIYDQDGLRQKLNIEHIHAHSALLATPSDGWNAVREALEEISAGPGVSGPPVLVRSCVAQLLRGDIPLDPLRLESTLRLQYDLQVSLLERHGLFEDLDGRRGITGVDGNWYPVPDFQSVLGGIERNATIQQKLLQGFDTLLLVPFGMPLFSMTLALRRGYEANESRVENAPRYLRVDNRLLDELSSQPLLYLDGDECGYGGRACSGRIKEAVLRADGCGWRAQLVEGSLFEIPLRNHGQVVQGRRQLECYRGSYIERRHPLPGGERGWTPETYIIRSLDALERQRRVLDQTTRTYLVGAYLHTEFRVPMGYCDPDESEAYLVSDPIWTDGHLDGIRTAVDIPC